jgi:hypothetical protein
MDDTDRDVLERCREYQSYLGTLEGYGYMPDIVDVIRDAADEIEHQRKLLGAAKDTAVELAMGIRSAYQSELERLRKIEAAARALTVDFNPMFDSGAEFNIRLRKLYVSIIENKFAETETDG